MSLQRVSSRPRLVSDTDMEFVNANEEGLTLDDGYGHDTTSANYRKEKEENKESGLYGGLLYDKSPQLLPPSTTLQLSSSASTTIAASPGNCNMIQDDNNNNSSSNESLEDLFTKQASVSSNSSNSLDNNGVDMKTPQHMIANELTIKDLLLKHSAPTIPVSNTTAGVVYSTTKRKRYSIHDDTKEKILMEKKMLYHPLSIPPPSTQRSNQGGLNEGVFQHREQRVAEKRLGKGLDSSSYPLSMRSPYYHDSLWKSSSTSLSSLPLQQQEQSLLPQQQSIPLNTTTTLSVSTKSKLQSLPSEHLTNIATYLQPIEVHILATTCKSIRYILLTDHSAKSDVWMKILRQRFSNVFLRIDGVKNEAEKEDGSSEEEGRGREGSATLNMFSWNGSVANELDAQLARMRSTTTRSGIHSSLEAMPTTTNQQQEEDVEQRRRKEVSTNDITFVDDYQLPIPGLPKQEIDESLCYDPYNECGKRSSNIENNKEVNLPLLACLLPNRYPQIIDPKTLQCQKIGRINGLRVVQTQQMFRSYLLMIDEFNTTIASEEQHDNIENEEEEEMVEIDDNDKLPVHQDTQSSTQVEVPVIQFIGSVGTGDRCIRSDQPFPPYPKNMDTSHAEKSHSAVSFGGFSSWMKSHSVRRRRRERKASRNAARSRASRDSSEHSSLSASDHTTNGNMTQPSTPVVSNLPATPNRNNQRSPLYRFISSLSHNCTEVDSVDTSSHYTTGSIASEDRAINDELNNYGMIVKQSSSKRKCNFMGNKLRHCGRGGRNNLRPFVIPTVLSDTRGDAGGRLVVDVTPKLVAYFEVTLVKQHGQRERSQSEADRLDHSDRINDIPLGHRRHRLRHAMPQPNIRQVNHQPLNDQPHEQRHECVAIGLSTRSFSPSNKMPGWDLTSYGYHGDDGGIFHGQGDMLKLYGPAFGPGDTVGCGLEYSTRRIFFVKNGTFLGYAFDACPKEVVNDGLFPTVGIDTECPIFMNFGERPFMFDLRGFAKNGAE